MHDELDLQKKLEELRIEHRDLDIVIEQLSDTAPVDMLRLQRLKKRKLALRDHIMTIENMLVPDIIA